MAHEVFLPRVDMDMTEGKIAHWYVRNGDPVSKGQVVFEIETDKATMEIEATADGVLQGSDGVTDVLLPVGQVVAWIVQPGEAVPPVGAAPAAQADADAPATGPVAVDQPAPAGPAASKPQHVLRATPLARSIARSSGVDLHLVQGSGPAGRVLARDLAGHDGLLAPATGAGSEPLHLHWFQRRAGVPLVLLHGFGTSTGSWRQLAQQLGDDIPVFGIDLPSHGKSPRTHAPDLAAVARMLLERLDQEGITALHLVGHSMGGGAALALVPMLRQRLRSLTLLAPLGLGPQINGAFIQGILRTTRAASLRPWLGMMFGDPAQVSGSFAASAWSELESPDTRAALATMADHLLP
ncbi:MAG: alpha/beta fold hydrolase, partial [Betaproteobacteria bacterium]